eukprot:CAMPEP_0177668522 /NCGR_PEP_ID=MMETSP0447-20121125/22827_1 /TAXON_ID=0 /ORGANISM="Stygamoeba regulata, Strain BSH-02190019" /LENGTH=50 /DNA_ID=CAMNT_0019175077 /DNA_START=180 /DNA_END=332 /DNA_ORIENTATION=+
MAPHLIACVLMPLCLADWLSPDHLPDGASNGSDASRLAAALLSAPAGTTV